MKTVESINELQCIEVKYAGHVKKFAPDHWEHDAWAVTINNRREGQLYVFPYRTGVGLRKPCGRFAANAVEVYNRGKTSYVAPTRPENAMIMHSLLVDATANGMSFVNWCSEYGYNTDSRKALDTYLKCCETAEALATHFTQQELADMREALDDY